MSPGKDLEKDALMCPRGSVSKSRGLGSIEPEENQNQSYFMTVCNLLCSWIGVMVLVFPQQFTTLGWGMSITSLVIAAAFSWLGSRTVCDVLDRADYEGQRPKSFAELGTFVGGGKGRTLFSSFALVVMISKAAIYTVLLSEILVFWIGDTGLSTKLQSLVFTDIVLYSWCMAVPLLALIFYNLRRPISKVILVSLVCGVACSATIGVASVIGKGEKVPWPPASLTEIGLSRDNMTKLDNVVEGFFSVTGPRALAIWGTLLGQVRGEACLPWDDDADVMVKREDWQQVSDDLVAAGFTVEPFYMGAWNNLEYWKVYNKDVGFWPFIDVVALDPISDGKYALKNTPSPWNIPVDMTPVPVKYSTFQIYRPKNAEALLDQHYPGWKQFALLPEYDHMKAQVTNRLFRSVRYAPKPPYALLPAAQQPRYARIWVAEAPAWWRMAGVGLAASLLPFASLEVPAIRQRMRDPSQAKSALTTAHLAALLILLIPACLAHWSFGDNALAAPIFFSFELMDETWGAAMALSIMCTMSLILTIPLTYYDMLDCSTELSDMIRENKSIRALTRLVLVVAVSCVAAVSMGFIHVVRIMSGVSLFVPLMCLVVYMQMSKRRKKSVSYSSWAAFALVICIFVYAMYGGLSWWILTEFSRAE